VENKNKVNGLEVWELIAENNRLRGALENIKKHMELVAPTAKEMSTVWQIADRALTATEDGGEK
jgi:maltose-binding protein MalE